MDSPPPVPPGTEPSTTEPLTFDRAEYETPPPARAACSLCGDHALLEFWRCGANQLCEACSRKLKREGLPPVPNAFLRALVLGAGAAVLGAGVWYGIRKATGYDLGLIGLAVGWFVGQAVRRGTGNRGGWLYQTLAIALVYLAIASTYVPYVYRDLVQPTDAGESISGEIAFVLSCVFSLAAPFLSGVFGIVIAGVALYEAWKLNKRPEYVVEGPFSISAPVPRPAGAASTAVTDGATP